MKLGGYEYQLGIVHDFVENNDGWGHFWFYVVFIKIMYWPGNLACLVDSVRSLVFDTISGYLSWVAGVNQQHTEDLLQPYCSRHLFGTHQSLP
jgi:hypothetical protein